ncbi:MAG: hypothetical protein IT556_02820 [Acetobacteraceae bacterium]|nr:hypothetical protein [Acetobacteraceae bacterium]
MWRAFIEAVGPFLVPFALYVLWLAALKRWGREEEAPGESDAAAPARPHPWIALSVAGLVLAFAVLALTSNRQRMAAGSQYAPAQLRGGEIVPGGPVTR